MMTESELKEVQARVRELSKKLDNDPRYQKAIKSLMGKHDQAWEKYDYEKSEIEKGNIPDLEKYENSK